MSNRLYHRDFLKEIDFTPEDLTYLLDLAAQLKQAAEGKEVGDTTTLADTAVMSVISAQVK